MKFGFALRRLTLTGPDLPDADLHFVRGLNVISGPSDTGKTFILHCIDFALGSGTPPKTIPEAEPYTSIVLELEAHGERRGYTLERSLRGGDIRLSSDGEFLRLLGARHQADKEDTVSYFLLVLSGLAGKKVRMNQQGKTRALSFRDVAPLVLINEESVISAASPVLSGQFTNRTAEAGVFRLLITGKDDSSVIAKQDPKIERSRQEGKAEILDELLQRARAQLTALNSTNNLIQARDMLARLQIGIESASAALAAEQQNAAAVEARRRSAWRLLREAQSKSDVLSELQTRFELLGQQYSSDLRRLEAITEAAFRLGQMKEERCPVCGAIAEHQASSHRQNGASPGEVEQACKAEAEKTLRLIHDLQATVSSNEEDIQRLGTERSAHQAELEATGAELTTLLQPRLQAAVQTLRDIQILRDSTRNEVELLERAQELEHLLIEANTPRQKVVAAAPASAVSTGEAEQFSREVEALLKAWQFPDVGRVIFSENDQDIVIDGRPRASHGKGVRAITRAAFNLALLRLCARDARPFPGFVVIDSPLVVYREPEVGETGFPPNVKDAFYREVAADFSDAQVIILENDAPPTDLVAVANCIFFTGTDLGRRGLIPVG